MKKVSDVAVHGNDAVRGASEQVTVKGAFFCRPGVMNGPDDTNLSARPLGSEKGEPMISGKMRMNDIRLHFVKKLRQGGNGFPCPAGVQTAGRLHALDRWEPRQDRALFQVVSPDADKKQIVPPPVEVNRQKEGRVRRTGPPGTADDLDDVQFAHAASTSS